MKDEFDFLNAMYRRLDDARRWKREHAEKQARAGAKKAINPYESMEISIEYSIRDYLTLTRKDGK